jgi:hypothetical protein
MPNFEYRFDVVAILLASVLSMLAVSAAVGGSKPGSTTDGRGGATVSSGPHGK